MYIDEYHNRKNWKTVKPVAYIHKIYLFNFECPQIKTHRVTPSLWTVSSCPLPYRKRIQQMWQVAGRRELLPRLPDGGERTTFFLDYVCRTGQGLRNNCRGETSCKESLYRPGGGQFSCCRLKITIFNWTLRSGKILRKWGLAKMNIAFFGIEIQKYSNIIYYSYFKIKKLYIFIDNDDRSLFMLKIYWGQKKQLLPSVF